MTQHVALIPLAKRISEAFSFEAFSHRKGAT